MTKIREMKSRVISLWKTRYEENVGLDVSKDMERDWEVLAEDTIKLVAGGICSELDEEWGDMISQVYDAIVWINNTFCGDYQTKPYRRNNDKD